MSLMNNATTYEALRKKYNNFLVPAVKLNIGGISLLEQKGVHIEEVQVKLSLKEAGSASFVINSQYDYEKHSFLSILKDKVIPGKKVEVSMGYGSDLALLFTGFIANVDIRLDVENGIFFQIFALDARRLMMTDNKPYILHEKKKYSDIVKDILGRYSSLCKLEYEATEETLTEAVCQRESDFDFIVHELIGSGKVEREFFIVADKAYFRKPRAVATPMLKLGINSGLKTFQKSISYLEKIIEVQGYQADQEKKIVAKTTIKSSTPQSRIIQPGTTVIIAADCESENQAKKIAKVQGQQELQQNAKTSGSCVGMPEIIPGRFLEIADVDSLIDQKYYVTEVTHTISEGGFVTQFQTEG